MNKATVVAMGNTKTCSYCRTLDAMIAKADMAEELPGADFIFADQAKDTKLYASWKAKAKLSGSIPQIAVFDKNGALKGKFVARTGLVKPWSIAGIVAKIEELCPDCCVQGGCDDEPADNCGCTCEACGCEVNFCPSCGKEL
jgi:hypothetical protein